MFVTDLTGALYVNPLWFYKHQHDKPSPLTCYKQFGTNSIIVLMFVESQRVHIWNTVRHVTKPWSVILLNKKHTYSYLKCIVYDKLLKPRQSFRITLYCVFRNASYHASYFDLFEINDSENNSKSCEKWAFSIIIRILCYFLPFYLAKSNNNWTAYVKSWVMVMKLVLF